MADLSIQRDMRRRIAEKEFEASLRKYILDGQNRSTLREFQFGGALNLISTVKSVFESLAEETGCSDYAAVAAKLADVELMADLPYTHEEAA